MKTEEELNEIRKEVESLNKKLTELTDDELKQVVGGNGPKEFDWRELGNVTPVGKSGGSTWGFSAEGNVDGQYFKKITEGLPEEQDELEKLKRQMGIKY